MSPLEPNWKRRRLRAPREEGEVLAIPPLADMPATIAQSREQIAKWDVPVLGRPLADLRRLAREEALTAAVRFTHQPEPSARNDLTHRASLDVPLIVGGHQPELFHPGVWAKNFVLDGLTKSTGGIGLHLIVDNDAITSTSIAVPVGSREQPRIEHIPFDTDANSVPWEEARLRDESLFRSFPDRVSAALSCWPIEPMLPMIWPAAIARLPDAQEQPRPRLVDLLTVVRREAEQRAGLSHLELPISQLCETESFAWFVCSLLSDPRRTHTVYNEVVAEYRRVNRVRNRQRPVPDLSIRANSDWLEFPFWVWQPGDSQRDRLFVRATTNEIQLANGETIIASLPLPMSGATESAVAQLRALSSRGWKLRPRALTTTLFARVFLADAFLHGIGGAKYDEMTDRLIARLFGVAPPSYLTVTATHRLPLSGWNVTPSNVAALNHRLWDFDHNPERFSLEGTMSLDSCVDASSGFVLASAAERRRNLAGGVSPRTTQEDDLQALKGRSEIANLNSSVAPARLPRPDSSQTGGLHPRLDSTATPWLMNVAATEQDTLPSEQSEAESLLIEKRRLVAEQQTQDTLDRHDPRRASRAENDHRRHRFRAINQRLATLASETRSALTTDLQMAQWQLAANVVLRSREYSFCLFSNADDMSRLLK